MTNLISQGAADLRDMLNDAWAASASVPVNFAGQTYQDALSGNIPDLYVLLYGDS
jgi:hypothetical protein